MIPRGQSGLGLLDVVLAMLVLAIGLLALALALPVAMKAVADGGARTVAVQAATGELATARSSAYERLPDLDTGGFVAVPATPGLERAIAVQTGVPTAGTTTVSVRVRWAGPAGPGDVIGLDTVIGP